MQTRHVTRKPRGKVYYDVHEGPRMADVQPRPEPWGLQFVAFFFAIQSLSLTFHHCQV